MHGTEQGAGNGGIRVGIATSSDHIDYTGLQATRVEELVKGVLECDQHPALIDGEIARGALLCLLRAFQQRSGDLFTSGHT